MSDSEDNDFNLNDNALDTITLDATRQGDQDETLPFNLADVPSSVEAEDALPQSEVFESIFLHQEGLQPSGHTWEQTKVYSVRLSTLARTFEMGDKANAINLLHRRNNLRMDSDLHYRSDNEMLAWDGSKHFLDFLLVIGSIGLDMFIPNKVAGHTFSISLNLCLQCHEFRPKFSKLGFDPTGCMMALGTGPSSELWLAFCPRENMEDLTVADEAPLINDRKHGDTRLITFTWLSCS
ncbi:hypothetical protein DEU56DRAFT_914595 [Suillus clintonianus]|uniref:uncharacterized protein n=1 Tax=Suillus clintonianus TaxID=1904413 RepID=UPI001B8865EF|nr:uncharacterized protein DEU56DRAFT_914595 [Suillus clintonianus]KAG2131056.1 hypothetical protein DEU56DRAFT_914595 [Suillus clintonianus]